MEEIRMVNQIEIQNEIMKNVKIEIQRGNDFCADCKENHLCNICRLNYMIKDLEDFMRKF